MTITEAIKNTQYVVVDSEEIYSTDIHNSLLLVIEAAKFVKGLRETGVMPVYALLPGETED